MTNFEKVGLKIYENFWTRGKEQRLVFHLTRLKN